MRPAARTRGTRDPLHAPSAHSASLIAIRDRLSNQAVPTHPLFVLSRRAQTTTSDSAARCEYHVHILVQSDCEPSTDWLRRPRLKTDRLDPACRSPRDVNVIPESNTAATSRVRNSMRRSARRINCCSGIQRELSERTSSSRIPNNSRKASARSSYRRFRRQQIGIGPILPFDLYPGIR